MKRPYSIPTPMFEYKSLFIYLIQIREQGIKQRCPIVGTIIFILSKISVYFMIQIKFYKFNSVYIIIYYIYYLVILNF
jgi:hypothetical protein